MPLFPNYQPPWRQAGKQERRQNVGDLHRSQKDLQAHSDQAKQAGKRNIQDQSPEYYRLNRRVSDQLPKVPPWQRTRMAHDVREAREQARKSREQRRQAWPQRSRSR